jgi:cytochrome oxidase assembly protein ShyY1
VSRSLLSWRGAGLTAFAVVLVVAFVLLGHWQYTRTFRPDGPAHLPAGPVALDTLSQPAQLLPADDAGRLVAATGVYDATHQYLLAGRTVEGRAADWVVAPLRLADGSAIVVVRGWVEPGTAPPRPPAGPVRLTGRLQVPDAPTGQPPLDAAGQLSDLSTADLAALVPYPLRDAYLVRVAQDPADALSAHPVPSPGPPAGAGEVRQFHLQNGIYTVQWFLFAAFVVFMWARILRDDARGQDPAVTERVPSDVLS